MNPDSRLHVRRQLLELGNSLYQCVVPINIRSWPVLGRVLRPLLPAKVIKNVERHPIFSDRSMIVFHYETPPFQLKKLSISYIRPKRCFSQKYFKFLKIISKKRQPVLYQAKLVKRHNKRFYKNIIPQSVVFSRVVLPMGYNVNEFCEKCALNVEYISQNYKK